VATTHDYDCGCRACTRHHEFLISRAAEICQVGRQHIAEQLSQRADSERDRPGATIDYAAGWQDAAEWLINGPGAVRASAVEPPPTFVDAYDTSQARVAFSNSFEGESWMGVWCSSCRHSSSEGGCTLTDVAMLGRTPAAWIELDRSSLTSRYLCLNWSSADTAS
jgi:hypothetical protein